MLDECIKFKDNTDPEFVFRVYKEHQISRIINECFSDIYHNRVKDGPRRPGMTTGGVYILTSPVDNIISLGEDHNDTLNVLRCKNGKVSLEPYTVIYDLK